MHRSTASSIIPWSIVPVLAGAILAIGSIGPLSQPAGAQTPINGGPGPKPLAPTATCQQADVDDLDRVITFVRGESWAKEPDSTGFQITPDTTACRVVLRINHLSADERAALTTGAGPRLLIQNVKDYARPSRLRFYLWLICGGSGLIWLYRRTRA